MQARMHQDGRLLLSADIRHMRHGRLKHRQKTNP